MEIKNQIQLNQISMQDTIKTLEEKTNNNIIKYSDIDNSYISLLKCSLSCKITIFSRCMLFVSLHSFQTFKKN